METIGTETAKQIIISSQLYQNNKTLSGKDHLAGIIENLGYVQIDTMSVVERSHHHTLWTRMNSYRRSMLDELLEKDKKIFEYWSHAAAYLPMKDFRYSLVRKRNHSKKYKEWGKANKKIIRHVYDRIKREGALQSKDFYDTENKSSGWWEWKPSKDALDHLFHNGKLMIAKRKGFQKVYDLTEKVLPPGTDTSFPSEKEFYRHLILMSVSSNGIISEKEIFYLRRVNKNLFRKILNELIEDNKILEIKINDFDSSIYYTLENKLDKAETKQFSNNVYILSPFDNLIIQRKRAWDFFGFDFQIECYVPANKRKFGYFCLPVMYGNKFVCKIDAKADRQRKVFVLKKIFWEDKIKQNEIMLRHLKKKINQFAKFTGCDTTESPNNFIDSI